MTDAMTQPNPDNPVLTEALRLLDCGLSVVPVRTDGTNAPALTNFRTFFKTCATEKQACAWWGNSRLGLAVVCGAVSGNLVCLDFDPHPDHALPSLYPEWRALAGAEGFDELLAALPVIATPSGGHKLFWRTETARPCEYPAYAPDPANPTGRLIRIETQGEGRQATLPPSPPQCHKLNRPYAYLQGDLAAVPTITDDDHDALLSLARTFNTWEPPVRPAAAPRTPRAYAPGALSPGTDFNRRGQWGPLLAELRLERKRVRGSDEYWGWADADKATCLVLHTASGEGGTVYLWTPNAFPLEPFESYDLFGAYARIRHGGDFAAATRALAAEGYGTPLPPREIVLPRGRADHAPFPPESEPESEADVTDNAETQNAEIQDAETHDAEAQDAETMGDMALPDERDAPPVKPKSARGRKARDTSSMALAQQWAEEHKGRYLFMEGAQWWRYNKGVWAYSNIESVQASVQHFLVRMHEVNPKIGVTPTEVRNIVFLAQSLLGPHPLSIFDRHTDWIGLENGVYDTETGILLPHSPDHRLTHKTSYAYDPAASCPTWRTFMPEVMLHVDGTPHQEWIDLIQEWFGVCQIPDTSAQTAMFWIGGGANGKGTTTRILQKLVGTEYCNDLPIEQLDNPYYRADLYGKLVSFVDEPDPRAMQKNGAYFKRLTGGNRIDARRPTEKVFNFEPTCRLVLTMNELLSTSDVSHAYFRRVLLIQWRYDADAPGNKQDRHLDRKLEAELPGIFNWAMEGLARWKARGRYFVIPEESQQLNADYRRGEDSIGGWMEEKLIDDPFGEISVADAFQSYSEWCKPLGMKPASIKALGQRLIKRKYTNEPKRIAGHSIRVWTGFRVDGQPITLEDEGL